MCDATEEETQNDGLGTDQNKQASLLHKCFFRKELQGGAYLKEREKFWYYFHKKHTIVLNKTN